MPDVMRMYENYGNYLQIITCGKRFFDFFSQVCEFATSLFTSIPKTSIEDALPNFPVGPAYFGLRGKILCYSSRKSPSFIVQTLPTNEPTPANDTAAPLAEGVKIGGCYALRRNLGKSDENAVWLASDEVLGKEVTLHFIPAAVAADARAMTELRQEVKRNRQLIHPNILRVYDFVEDGNHVAISMDAYEGESLQDLLSKKGRLDPEDLKPWIASLAETLSDAHRIQLFHRDLAPANLRLRPNGGLLVANFGLSRVILNSLERAGVAKGAAARLAYLSPQQLDGERPSASDDIYGLGVLMHELLCGAPPFAGEDLVPQIRKTVPPAVTDVRATNAGAPVPASWEKLIAGCLAKSPEARPRNISEVLALLGQDSGPARPRVQPVAAQPAPQNTPAADLDAPLKAPVNADAKPESGSSAADERKSASAAPAAETPVEKSSPSRKPLHPEMPPVSPGTAVKKSPAKGTLSANFPDLDRPRSKAPLVWLLLAAGIIGVGIWMRNSPDPAESDNGSVKRLDNDASGQVSTSVNGAGKTETPEAKSPDSLPDPQPIAPAKIAGTAQANSPDEVTAQLPKNTATASAKPPKTGALIGSESTAPATNVVPDSLVGASAQSNAKTPGDTKPPGDVKPAANTAATAEVKPPVPDKTAQPPLPPVASNTATAANTAAAATAASAASTANTANAASTVTPPEKNAGEPTAPAAPKTEPLPVLPEAPQPLAKLVLPEKATAAQIGDVKKQREAAVEDFRKTSAAADAAHQEATRRLDVAKAEREKRQKDLDAKRKTLTPVIQQADAIEVERKKFEDEFNKAHAAAAEAAKQAEAAKKKLEDTVAKGGEKLKARQQAEGELNAATTQIASLAKEVDGLSQIITKADTLRQQTRLAQQQAEQDLQKIAAAAEKARVAEMEAQRKASQEKIAAIDKQVQDLKAQVVRYDSLIGQLKELISENSADAVKKAEEKKAAVQQQITELQAEAKRLSGGAATIPDKPPGKDSAAVKQPAPTPEPAKPEKEKDPAPAPAPAGAVATNSLGMKFIPVGDVQFSVYLTTRKDFEAFATATGLKSDAWRNPGFKQEPDHPVVNVTWREAEAFCKWLTEKERKGGLLKGEVYRLPTDAEWSKAVGLPAETGATPEERDMGVQDIYPWGNQWPPPAGAGNYAGEETQTDIPIPNYNDGYANTSPVGKFRPNPLGIYDMGGNVWQWVADYWNGDNRSKTLRGGSWYNGAIPLSLLSSCRISSSPDTLHDTYGFRIVKAADSAKSKRR